MRLTEVREPGAIVLARACFGWVESGRFPLNYEWENPAALIRFLEGIDAETLFTGLAHACAAEVEAGASRREAAECVEVSASSAIKWMQRLNETGSIAAKPSGGSISPLEAHADVLLALIAEQPDLTLDEIVAVMRQRGSPQPQRGAAFLPAAQYQLQKPAGGRAERADVARARRRWMREQGMFDPARLVFIDETSTNTAMVRLRGRCPARHPIDRSCSARALEDDHLHRRPAPSCDGGALRAGWTHECNIFHGLSQTMSRSQPQARRYRDDG